MFTMRWPCLNSSMLQPFVNPGGDEADWRRLASMSDVVSIYIEIICVYMYIYIHNIRIYIYIIYIYIIFVYRYIHIIHLYIYIHIIYICIIFVCIYIYIIHIYIHNICMYIYIYIIHIYIIHIYIYIIFVYIYIHYTSLWLDLKDRDVSSTSLWLTRKGWKWCRTFEPVISAWDACVSQKPPKFKEGYVMKPGCIQVVFPETMFRVIEFYHQQVAEPLFTWHCTRLWLWPGSLEALPPSALVVKP